VPSRSEGPPALLCLCTSSLAAPELHEQHAGAKFASSSEPRLVVADARRDRDRG
jgi:hypothetical protein